MRFSDLSATDESEFVQAVLSGLQVAEAKELVKISVCQLIKAASEPLLGWITPRNGKFYFNPDVNGDADTVAWAAFRDKFVRDVSSKGRVVAEAAASKS